MRHLLTGNDEDPAAQRRHIRRAFASAFSFSTTCSGACTTTVPMVSWPARPARPAIW